jgi:hypothetical protein
MTPTLFALDPLERRWIRRSRLSNHGMSARRTSEGQPSHMRGVLWHQRSTGEAYGVRKGADFCGLQRPSGRRVVAWGTHA